MYAACFTIDCAPSVPVYLKRGYISVLWLNSMRYVFSTLFIKGYVNNAVYCYGASCFNLKFLTMMAAIDLFIFSSIYFYAALRYPKTFITINENIMLQNADAVGTR